MFKAFKRRSAGKKRELYEFKFKFQATRVPSGGPEKLVVCLVPLGNSRSSSKTTKAPVQNGVCHWSDTLVERVKLYRDKRTGLLEEKIYRLVVSTGSSRAGILGETHINFADCTSSQAEQRSLTLKHCTAGTILHTSMSCTFTKASNDTDGESASAFEDHDVFSEEEPLSDPEQKAFRGAPATSRPKANGLPTFYQGGRTSKDFDSPTHAAGNGGFSPGHLRRGSMDSNLSAEAFYTGAAAGPSLNVDELVTAGPAEPWTVNPPMQTAAERMRGVSPRVSWKEGARSPADLYGPGYNPPGERRLSASQSSPSARPYDSPSQSRSIGALKAQVLRTNSSPGMTQVQRTPAGVSFSPGKPMEGMTPTEQELLSELEKAEIKMENLQVEAEQWKQSALKYSVEIEALQVQMQELGRAGQEVQFDQEALIRERSELRAELAELKAAQEDLEAREHSVAATAWEAEEAHRLLRELRNQNKEQADQINNFKLQLGKIQESNMMLVEAVKDSEEAAGEMAAELEDARAALKSLKRQQSRRTSEATTRPAEQTEKPPGSAELAARLLAMEAEREVLLEKLRKAQLVGMHSRTYRGSVSPISPGKLRNREVNQQSAEELKKLVKDLEEEAEELTDENLKLASDLTQAHKDLEEKDQALAALEAHVREVGTLPAPPPSAEVERLQVEVAALERKLAGALEEAREHGSRARDMANEADTVVQLRREVTTYREQLLAATSELDELKKLSGADARTLADLSEASAAAKAAAREALESKKQAEREKQALQAELAAAVQAREEIKAQFAAEAAEANGKSEQRIAALQAEVSSLLAQVSAQKGGQAAVPRSRSSSAIGPTESADLAVAKAEERCRKLESELVVLMMRLRTSGQVTVEDDEMRAQLEAAADKAQRERDRLSSRLLEVEQGMAAEEAARREAEATARSLRKRLAEMEEETAKKTKSLHEQVATLMQKADQAKPENSLAEGEGASELQERLKELESAKQAAEERIAMLEGQVAAAKEAQAKAEAECQDKQAELQKAEEQVASLSTQIEEHKTAKASFESQHQEALTKATDSTSSLENQLTKLKGELANALAKQDDLQVQVTTALQEKAEVTATLEHVQTEVTKLKEEMAAKEGALKAVEKEKEGVDEQVKELESLREKVKGVELSRNEAVAKAEANEEERRKIGGKMQLLEGQVLALTAQVAEHVASKRENETRAFELHAAKGALQKQLAQAQEELKEVTGKLTAIENEVAESKAAMQADTKQRRELEATTGKEVRELTAVKAALEAKLAGAEEAVRRAEDEKAAAVARLQGELEQLTAQLSEGLGVKEKAASEALVQASELRSQKAELEETLKKVQEECGQLAAARTELERQVLQLREEGEAVQLKLTRLETNTQELQAEVQELRSRESSAVASSSKYKAEAEELRVSLAETFAATRAVRGAKDTLEDKVQTLEDRAQRAEALLAAAQLKANQAEQERTSLGTLLESLRGEKRGVEEQSRDLDRKLASAEAQLTTVQGQLVALQLAKATVEERLVAAERSSADVAVLQREKSTLEATVAGLQQKDEQSKQVAARAESLSKEVEGLQQERQSLQAKVGFVEAACSSAKEEVASSKKEAAEQVKACKAEEKKHWEALLAEAASRAQADLSEAEKRAAATIAAAEADLEEVRASNLELRRQILKHETEVQTLKEHVEQLELEREQEKTVLTATDAPALPPSKGGFFSRNQAPKEVQDLRKKVALLEAELQKKTEALDGGEKKVVKSTTSPPTSPPSAKEVKMVDDLKHKVKTLEGELKRVVTSLDKLKRESLEKEKGFLQEVERLQHANLQLAKGGMDMGVEQLRLEVVRLQNTNADLTRRERDLTLKLHTHELLDAEVTRLQEVNDELLHKMRLFESTDDRASMVDKVHQLEMELAEALEANTMYREQLKNTFSQSDNVAKAAMLGLGVDNIEQLVEELRALRATAKKYDDELRDMRARYSDMSLRFAEVEAEREQLVQEKRGVTTKTKT